METNQITVRQQVWLQAFHTAIEYGKVGIDPAVQWADKGLAGFEKAFPETKQAEEAAAAKDAEYIKYQKQQLGLP